jgi:hypothetical protein
MPNYYKCPISFEGSFKRPGEIPEGVSFSCILINNEYFVVKTDSTLNIEVYTGDDINTLFPQIDPKDIPSII